MSHEAMFAGKTWVITGALKDISRKEATRQLEAKGASVTGSVTSKTDYLVSAGYDPSNVRFLSTKEIKARQHEIPIFNEPQLLTILAGGTLDAVEALAPVVEPVEEVAVRDALEQFRDLLYETPDWQTWETICELVDQCSPVDLPVVVDYVAGNVEGWPEQYTLSQAHHYGLESHRLLPDRWRHDLYLGVDSVKLKLVRVANLNSAKLDTKVGLKVLSCRSLCNLRLLDLGRNKLTAAFFSALGQAEQFKGVRHLRLGGTTFNAAAAKAFEGGSVLAGVESLVLDSSTFKGGSLTTFLGAPCWGALRSLSASWVRSEGGDVLAALYNAPHIDKLEMLDLSSMRCASSSSVVKLCSDARYAGLRRLHLGAAPLGDAGVEALKGASWLGHLEELDLTQVTGDERLAELLGSASMPALEVLRVGVGLEAICGNEGLWPRQLVFRGHLDEGGLEVLLASELLGRLEGLSLLGGAPTGALVRLLRSPATAGLTHLAVASERIGAEAVEAMVHGQHLVKLGSVGSSLGDDLTRAHVEAFKGAEHLSEPLREELGRQLQWHVDYLERRP